MTIRQWIELAATLDIDGLEFYTGFLELADPHAWKQSREIAADHGLTIPMLCCSPDFTHPDPAFRREQVNREKHWIEMTAELGGTYCRVLSGQRRPGLAAGNGTTLCRRMHLGMSRPCRQSTALRSYWRITTKTITGTIPSLLNRRKCFATWCRVSIRRTSASTTIRATHTWRVKIRWNFSDRVKNRVVTMHASDRYLIEGTLDDLRREEDQPRLCSPIAAWRHRRRTERLRCDFRQASRCWFRWLDQHRRRSRWPRTIARKRVVLAPQNCSTLAGGSKNRRCCQARLVSFGTAPGKTRKTSTMGEAQKLDAPLQADQRLLSLDALRGFDMFWIIGGKEIVLGGCQVNQLGLASVAVEPIGACRVARLHVVRSDLPAIPVYGWRGDALLVC